MSETHSKLEPVDTEKMQTLKETKVVQKEYVLPPASTTTLGGVVVGDGVSVDENGVISVLKVKKVSKYYANDYNEGIILADVFSLGTIDFLINEEYPANRIITDISVHINEDGDTKEYSSLGLYMNGLISGTAIPHISQKTEPESTHGMFAVAYISNLDTMTSDFYAMVSSSPENVAGLTVHYVEI